MVFLKSVESVTESSRRYRYECTDSSLVSLYMKTALRLVQDKSKMTINDHREVEAPIKIQNQLIPYNSSVKYLGLTLDPKLTFQQHTTKTINKVYFMLSVLYPILKSHILSQRNNWGANIFSGEQPEDTGIS